jgi:hypothetical protein
MHRETDRRSNMFLGPRVLAGLGGPLHGGMYDTQIRC